MLSLQRLRKPLNAFRKSISLCSTKMEVTHRHNEAVCTVTGYMDIKNSLPPRGSKEQFCIQFVGYIVMLSRDSELYNTSLT